VTLTDPPETPLTSPEETVATLVLLLDQELLLV